MNEKRGRPGPGLAFIHKIQAELRRIEMEVTL